MFKGISELMQILLIFIILLLQFNKFMRSFFEFPDRRKYLYLLAGIFGTISVVFNE